MSADLVLPLLATTLGLPLVAIAPLLPQAVVSGVVCGGSAVALLLGRRGSPSP